MRFVTFFVELAFTKRMLASILLFSRWFGQSNDQAEQQPLTLETLVAQAQGGDGKHAFHVLFEMCNDKVFRYVLPRVSSREDALDLVQDVFIDLWNSLKKFTYRSEGEFYAFLFLIAKRRLGKHYRDSETTLELSEDFVGENFEIEFKDYRSLEALVKRLKEDDAEVIRLRYWSGLSFREIAAVLDISENNAKVRHHRAIEKLKSLTVSYEH